MSEEERKQQFLRSEIIDQGYNPDDFTTYMGSLRGEEGLNIENWTFEVVEECEKKDLTARESYWIKFYGSKEYGLNMKE